MAQNPASMERKFSEPMANSGTKAADRKKRALRYRVCVVPRMRGPFALVITSESKYPTPCADRQLASVGSALQLIGVF